MKNENKKTILIVDPSKEIHQAFDLLFHPTEYTLIHATSATEAIAVVEGYFRRNMPLQLKVAFIEHDLYGMSGSMLIRYLKSLIIPEIHCFGISQPQWEHTMLLSGADGFFEKPFNDPVIENIIKTIEMFADLRDNKNS